MTNAALPSRASSATIGSAMRPVPTTSPDLVRRELHERVLGYVGRRVRSRDDAEDIAQEVMLRIHRHSADLEHVDRMAAWVYRIAGNAIADHYRRPARREVPSGQATDVPERNVAPSAGGVAEPSTDELREELAQCLAPLIDRLAPAYREAIELTEFGGVSQVDAAAQLGLSVSGMKARVQRARRQLRELLLECCHVELDRRRAVTGIQSRGGVCGTCGRPLR
jgi:RNA polymerase sigma-70 factor (ECF subfamily)